MARHNIDPELDALLDEFVCVRLVQMGGVDLSVFQFDPMLSWSLFLMNGHGEVESCVHCHEVQRSAGSAPPSRPIAAASTSALPTTPGVIRNANVCSVSTAVD